MVGSRWGDNSRWHHQRALAKRQKLIRFRNALSDGASITEAARTAGVGQQRGSQYFREICLEIDGPQLAAGYGRWAV